MSKRKKDGKEIAVQSGATDKLFNFRPFFFAGAFLCLGVAFGYFYRFQNVSAWWLTALLPCAITPFLFCNNRVRLKKTALALLVLTAAFALGTFSFSGQVRNYTNTPVYEGEHTVEGRVLERRENDYGIVVLLDRIRIDGKEENGKLVAYLPASFSENITLSDCLVLEGEVKTDTQLFNDYGFYTEKLNDDRRFKMSVESCVIVEGDFDLFLFLRQRIHTVTYAGMDETSAALTVATLTGDTYGIEEGLLENVRRGGIAHVFAVSGLHVGALYAFCLSLFSKTKLKNTPKGIRFALLTAILLFYGGICGFSASVIRATVLCLTFYLSKLVGIASDSTESLGLAAIAVLLISPADLFTVGFQLSFVACLGIVWLARPLQTGTYALAGKVKGWIVRGEKNTNAKNRAERPPSVSERIVRVCVSFLSVTVAAQIATAPILLSSFGYLSVWSLLLNCLFVPLISAAFSLLLLFVAVACLLPTAVSSVVLYLPLVVWSALILLFQTVEFSVVLENLVLSGGSLLCYYMGLTFSTDKWNMKKSLKIVVVVMCFIGFGITVYALNR